MAGNCPRFRRYWGLRRILALLAALLFGKAFAGDELATRLDVAPRTLRRDVDRLRSHGYAVETRPGPSGHYRLAAGRAIPHCSSTMTRPSPPSSAWHLDRDRRRQRRQHRRRGHPRLRKVDQYLRPAGASELVPAHAGVFPATCSRWTPGSTRPRARGVFRPATTDTGTAISRAVAAP
ncbi:HTH domain-containing protein [Actinokineospora pegani]|uniref:HTH domain-containing protein n=1 Tax=Actinokineospora pegani TaxID=2654637 RepID=UPI001F182D29|nr:HTH domain-containing protein [Actinokineospora pegani]